MGFGGWLGKLLRINLSTGSSTVENIAQKTLSEWIGGRGLGVYFLAQEVPATCNPLGAENKLFFATGPLTGTAAPGSERVSVSAKSPLTGTLLEANSGGSWGTRLKQSGYDLLLIEGVSPEPVYLTIAEDTVILHPAEDLWGTDVLETNDILKERLGSQVSIACIGPAGENLVNFAAIMNDGPNTLGRGGLGAVMGAKKLKAIAVQGKQKTPIANQEKFDFVHYEADKWLKANPITAQGLPEFGTPILVSLFNDLGAFPGHNFQSTPYPEATAISGETIAETLAVGSAGCGDCPVRCNRLVKSKMGTIAGPEYESIWALGAECGISDLETIVTANYLCRNLGLDPVSTGVTIGCAMELTARGHLRQGLHFGDRTGLLQTIRQVARRQNLGALLAEGSRALATSCGQAQYAMQVKGLELDAYDPRGLQGLGLSLATSNLGGCHMQVYMTGPEALGIPKMVDRFTGAGKAGLAITLQNNSAAIDSLLVCRLVSLAISEEYWAKMLSAVTGMDYQTQDLNRIGERIWNLERLYNLQSGLDCSSDTLPPRLLEEPIPGRDNSGTVVQLKPMLEAYYRFRGWSESGLPTAQKLRQLGLEEFTC